MPQTVATARASEGLVLESGDAVDDAGEDSKSVLVLMGGPLRRLWRRRIRDGLVDDRLADLVFLAGPIA